MAKSKEAHEKDIIEVITKFKVTNIQHIFPYYSELRSSQFYNLELEKSESIKEAIGLNRQKACSFMLQKWIASDRDALQISAFKILCSDDERKALSMTHTESNVKVRVSEYEDWTPEQIESEIKRLSERNS